MKKTRSQSYMEKMAEIKNQRPSTGVPNKVEITLQTPKVKRGESIKLNQSAKFPSMKAKGYLKDTTVSSNKLIDKEAIFSSPMSKTFNPKGVKRPRP